jgi:CRP-like cAMP-binding protein
VGIVQQKEEPAVPFTNLGKDFASLPVFQGVDVEVLRELIATAHSMQYQKGAVIVELGAPIPRCYVVLEGWCGAGKGNADGQEAILQLFRRGDFLFETSSEGDLCPINLQALTPVHLLSLSPAAVRAAQKRSVALINNMLIASAQRCQELRDHIEQLALHSAEQRVGRFLLQLRFTTSPEGKNIVLPFDKSSIAAYLGIKPETLSRTLQTFRDRGFKVERSHITIPSREALCEYCDKIIMRSCPFANTQDCRIFAPIKAAS